MGEDESLGLEPFSPGFYSRLEVEEVLSEFDGPILLLARDPSPPPGLPKSWLINWRAGGPRSARSPILRSLSGLEQWLAIPLSERRRALVIAEHVSLRETITLAEFQVFRLEGSDPFHPATVGGADVRSMDRNLLPSGDVSVYGNSIALPGGPIAPDSLHVTLHLIPGQDSTESTFIAVSSAIQECLQRFLSWGARSVLNSSSGGEEAELSIPVDDWAGLSLVGAAPGTLTVVTKAASPPGEARQAVVQALRVLAQVGRGQTDEGMAQKIGARAGTALVALTGLLHALDLSLAIRWGVGDDEEFAAIRGSRSDRLRTQLLGARWEERLAAEDRLTAELVVHLAPEEAAALRKPVDRQAGGFQALIDSLQRNLDGVNLRLTPSQVERVVRYVQDYGEGTYENRLRPVYGAIQRYGSSFVGLR